jgi:hypothetical protein
MSVHKGQPYPKNDVETNAGQSLSPRDDSITQMQFGCNNHRVSQLPTLCIPPNIERNCSSASHNFRFFRTAKCVCLGHLSLIASDATHKLAALGASVATPVKIAIELSVYREREIVVTAVTRCRFARSARFRPALRSTIRFQNRRVSSLGHQC